MRNIKILGLLAVSAMALVAFVGTASASAASFTAGTNGASLGTRTLVQEVLNVTGAETKCASNFIGKTEGVLEGGKIHNATQTVHPEYTNCSAFGFTEGVSVNTGPKEGAGSCHYTFQSATDGAGMAAVNLSECGNERTVTDSEAPGGSLTTKGVIILVSNIFATCEVIIPSPQTIASAVSYANNAGKIKMKFTANTIEAFVIKSTGLCPLKAGTHKEGSGVTINGETEAGASGTILEYTK